MTLLILVVAWLLSLNGCTKEMAAPAIETATALSPTAGQAIDVKDATAAQCAAGGKVYVVFTDLNHNGVYNSDEAILSTQIVCNGNDGVTGTNGLSTLFSLGRVATGFTSCLAGSGLQINSGLDQNGNGVLDASEISQAQILCDGQNGATGAAGPAGVNGHGVVFQMLAASAVVCPAGGKVILMAVDATGSGVYSAMAPGQQSLTVCNGASGTNGMNGVDGANGANGHDAVTPAYAPVEPIMPCGNTVAYKEVLLRLSNGQVLASFSDNASGAMTRLTFLPDGTFMDTDNSSCTFALSTSSDGHTRSMSWFGSTQISWAMP